MHEHIKSMRKTSTREKLLAEGSRVIRERGYTGASVRDIITAAGVPQGSFTYHFSSKEAFCLDVLEMYIAHIRRTAEDPLLNSSLSPLARLEAYLDGRVGSVSELARTKVACSGISASRQAAAVSASGADSLKHAMNYSLT
jgi:TetR/AcrR family transcriptional repressor of nem operon